MGETVRIFFGVGGPNFTSSFHVIGEMFDRVYNLGGVLSEPLKGIQTVTVPPGGAARDWPAGPVRHGVTKVGAGRRFTRGLVFHDVG